jgi:hypothetical protein
VRYCLALCVIDCTQNRRHRRCRRSAICAGQRARASLPPQIPAATCRKPRARRAACWRRPGDHSLAELRPRRIGIIDLQPRVDLERCDVALHLMEAADVEGCCGCSPPTTIDSLSPFQVPRRSGVPLCAIEGRATSIASVRIRTNFDMSASCVRSVLHLVSSRASTPNASSRRITGFCPRSQSVRTMPFVAAGTQVMRASGDTQRKSALINAQTAVERELVLRLASLLWRSRRAIAIETSLFQIHADIYNN